MSTQPQMMPPAKRDSLLPVKDGKRSGYAMLTCYWHDGRNIELVIGARTRKLVAEIHHGLTGETADRTRIYAVTWSKR